MSLATSLLNAAEFARLPDPGHPQELVRGVIVNIPPPKFRPGKVCNRIVYLLTSFVEVHHLGHVINNDSGVVTEQQPDTVRGPDVYFVSYAKIPEDAYPEYLTVAPDAVFEVLSPSDRKGEVQRKVAEYLQMGVNAVYVFDPDTRRVHCYYPEQPEEILATSEVLVGIGALAGFRVPVAKLFE